MLSEPLEGRKGWSRASAASNQAARTAAFGGDSVFLCGAPDTIPWRSS